MVRVHSGMGHELLSGFLWPLERDPVGLSAHVVEDGVRYQVVLAFDEDQEVGGVHAFPVQIGDELEGLCPVQLHGAIEVLDAQDDAVVPANHPGREQLFWGREYLEYVTPKICALIGRGYRRLPEWISFAQIILVHPVYGQGVVNI